MKVADLGPVAVPYGSQLQRASPPTAARRVVSKLAQRLLYAPAEKVQAFLLVFLITGVLALSRWSTGWETPIDHYIPRGPWIPQIYGDEQPGLITDSVWISIVFVLFAKTWVSLVGARPDFFGDSWHVSNKRYRRLF
jgi:hypothetical protein